MKDLIEKISSLTRYSDCSMPNTEEDRINIAQSSAYNQAIRDVIILLQSEKSFLSTMGCRDADYWTFSLLEDIDNFVPQDNFVRLGSNYTNLKKKYGQ